MRLGNQRVTVIFYVHIMKLTLWYPSHPFISLSFLLGLLHILLDPFHIPICVTAIHSRAVSSAEMRHKFYSQLDSAIQQVSNNEYLMLWSTSPLELDQIRNHCPCLGHLRVKKTNENGHHLLELYTFQKLCFTNTHFATDMRHRVTS